MLGELPPLRAGRRLYGTACPKCGDKMEELSGMVVKCGSCGFSAPH
ncbi:MAG: hypothetical protein LM577_00660 [Thermoproteaceae archaeon]|jgi:predicted RNA-binding Zn-ribbon protein involved in translation (DUF1610 family)|nr:hypothetical protein [Thermoproteaceae archaeon]